MKEYMCIKHTNGWSRVNNRSVLSLVLGFCFINCANIERLKLISKNNLHTLRL